MTPGAGAVAEREGAMEAAVAPARCADVVRPPIVARLPAAMGNRAFASAYGRGTGAPPAALAPAIGNRAFAALQRQAQAPKADERSPEPAAPVTGHPTRMLQRSIIPPPWRPFPSWATKDPAQPFGDCLPIPSPVHAMDLWLIVKGLFHKAINAMCRDCPAQALEVYDAYMDATGRPRFVYDEARDGLTCQIRSLKGDRNHEPAEQPVIEAVRRNLPALLPRLAGVPSVTLSLTDAGVPRTLIHPDPAVGCTHPNGFREPACLFLGSNVTFGSFLFGKGHEVGSIVDSEYGNDTRDVDGTVELTKIGLPTDPTIRIQMVFRFDWELHDAVDFCPGNTMPFDFRAHFLLGSASQLEASGMARDISVAAQYTRVRDHLPLEGPFPNPDFRPPPPAPHVVRLPAEVLFDFNHDDLRPGAAAGLVSSLGSRPRQQDPSRRVEVRGHTDSRGSSTYNQGLSERRARTIAALLEHEYPNLVGLVDAVGFGATQPVQPNTNPDGSDNPAGRAANRRVDIEFNIDVP
jgi:outer membrane protein OmpA-like peptidoglycan-associated protein